ncbi:MAG: Na+/H+ antiporter subunit D [Verrucomicrobiota bacterium]
MNTSLLAIPILLPIAGAAIGLLLPRNSRTQSIAGIATFAGTLVAALWILWSISQVGFLKLELGSWQAPFGISLVADKLAAAMVAISSLVGLAISIYALGDLSQELRKRWFYPLSLFLVAAVNGAFLSADLFNLYVWFEIMLISSFGLMLLGGGKNQFEGGFKYVAINLVASALFLAGLGLLYGKIGTLNMADIALKLSVSPGGPMINSSAVFFLVAFAIKAGMFPFFFWLPASYHTPPISVSALFAGLLTKVGVYALIRSNTLIFTQEADFLRGVLVALSLATMFTGVLGAAAQFDIKRILSFHIISQIGYMTLGLAVFTELAIAAAIFYTLHHIIVKTNLFLIAGIVSKKTGTDDLSAIGGLYKAAPWLALLFFIPAFSLGGIPPLSGFWAKFALVKESLDQSFYWATAIALIVGIMTLFSMTKIWAEAFWKKSPGLFKISKLTQRETWTLYGPVAAFSAITLIIGLNAQPLFEFSSEAAAQLLSPNQYIEFALPAEYVTSIRLQSVQEIALNATVTP